MITKELKHKMDREDLIKHLDKMLAQIVVLCNHLSGGREPFEDYVNEKLTKNPVLDRSNLATHKEITEILHRKYGVDLTEGTWRH